MKIETQVLYAGAVVMAGVGIWILIGAPMENVG